MTSTLSPRPPVYAEPAIYRANGRIYSIRDGYELRPVSERLHARPDPVSNFVFWALLIGMGLGFCAAVIGFACAVLRGF